MLWTLQVNFKTQIPSRDMRSILPSNVSSTIARTQTKSLAFSSTSTAAAFRFKVKSLKVLQSSGSTSMRLGSDKSASPIEERDGQGSKYSWKRSIEEEEATDPFLEEIPIQSLTLDDCIIDKKEHKTIQEQREYYREKLRAMASQDTEHKWELYGETSPTSKYTEQLKVYKRTVKWSPVAQFRSAVETKVDVIFLFEDIRNGMGREVVKRGALSDSTHVQGNLKTFNYVFIEKREDWATALQYRTARFPWPLSPRDFFLVVDHALAAPREAKAEEQWFCMFTQSLESPLCRPRKGFVRCTTRNQGLIGEGRDGNSGARLTCLFNTDFHGSSLLNAVVEITYLNAMIYPLAKVKGAEKRGGLSQRDSKSKDTVVDPTGDHFVRCERSDRGP